MTPPVNPKNLSRVRAAATQDTQARRTDALFRRLKDHLPCEETR